MTRPPRERDARSLQTSSRVGGPGLARTGGHRAVPILVADLTVVLTGNAIPAPLLAAYRAKWALTPLGTTLIFGIYAVGVVVAIVLAGRVADQIGARPVVAFSLACAAAAAFIALLAPGVLWLYLARIVQGVAAGLVGGAATAAITDVNEDPRMAARWAAVGTTAGIAVGLVLAGAVGQAVSHDLTWVWVVYLVLLLVAALVSRSLEGMRPARRPRLAITRPGLPDRQRAGFLRAIAGAGLAFGCMGLLAGLGPSLALALGVHTVLGDAAVAALAYVVSGVSLATLGDRMRSPGPGMLVLVAGLIALIVAVQTASTAWLVLAVATIGLGNGLTFRVTLSAANHLAPPDRRAEIISTYNIAMYTSIVVVLLVTALIAQMATLRSASLAVAVALSVGAITLAALERATARHASTAVPRSFSNRERRSQ